MIGAGRPCAEIAMQLQAVEKAITAAKRTLIHDHIDHCLDDLLPPGDAVDAQAFADFRQIAKYL
jgi:DNA-binding FrmR family transcriptional regulator